jgi:hypothetical protein
MVVDMLTFRIGNYDQFPDPFFVERNRPLMNLSDKVLKSVAFLGIRKNGRFLPRATAFFVQWTEDQHRFDHLVTAEHVISGLLTKNQNIWLRVNLVSGGAAEIKMEPSLFYFHPQAEKTPTDVAVCPISHILAEEESGELAEADIRFLNLNGQDGFLPSPEFRKQYMGRGGNIGIIGLFRSHYGKERNVPIVRVGTIAALPEEPVLTKIGYVEAYLIEARSIAGLSGSPVFAYPDLALELAKGLRKEPRSTGAALMGLVHGHFDVPNLNEDVVTDEDAPERSVHTGIGVVVPVEKIVETIKHPDLVAMRKDIVKKLRESGATPDLADDVSESPPPASDENPTHLEDFTRLVGAAARKPERED